MTQYNIKEELNLKGVLCPTNFVKTKLKLEELNVGEILKVVIDEGEPMQNVPKSVKDEGHKILQVQKNNDSTFTLLIEKR